MLDFLLLLGAAVSVGLFASAVAVIAVLFKLSDGE